MQLCNKVSTLGKANSYKRLLDEQGKLKRGEIAGKGFV
jgi:hypothetical protein